MQKEYRKIEHDFIPWLGGFVFESREVFQIVMMSLSVLIELGVVWSLFLKHLSPLNGPEAKL